MDFVRSVGRPWGHGRLCSRKRSFIQAPDPDVIITPKEQRSSYSLTVPMTQKSPGKAAPCSGACGSNANGGSGGGCSAYYSRASIRLSDEPTLWTQAAAPYRTYSLNAAFGQNYYFGRSIDLEDWYGMSIVAPEPQQFFRPRKIPISCS